MKSSSTFTALALGLGLIASSALADPPDSMSRIVPRPAGSSVVGLTAMYGQQGLLYSADSGETFGQMCKGFATVSGTDSDGEPTTHTPQFGNAIVTHDDRFLIGDFDGLWADDGHGCGWRLLPELEGSFVSKLRFDPRDPKVVYGATATYMADTGLFRVDAALQVERIGVQDQTMQIFGMDVVALPDGGLRFYTFGVLEQRTVLQNEDGGLTFIDLDAGVPVDDAGFPLANLQSLPIHLIRHSDDFGQTWTSHELEGRVGFSTDFEGVDPSNPDRIVISQNQDNLKRGSLAIPDQILVSDDRGQTFRKWLKVGSISGVSFAKDGTVYVADRGEGMAGDRKGLWRAASLDAEPERIADFETWCVDAREDRLEVCQRFEWGTLDPENGTFTKLTSMRELSAFHTCDGMDSEAVCRDELCASHCLHWKPAPLCLEHYPECAMENLFPTEDSGAPDASTAEDAATGNDAGAATDKEDGCSCGVVGQRRERSWHAGSFGAALALLFFIRRRRARGEVVRAAVAVAVLALAFSAQTARANSPDSCAKITPRQPGSDVIGITARFGQEGLIYSKDGGKTFAVMCKAFGATDTIDSFGDPRVLTPEFDTSTIVLPDGHFVAGGFHGLWIDDGQGCDWQLVPELAKTVITGLTYDPLDPNVIYGVTATGGQDNGLFKRNTDGTIERVGTQDSHRYFGLQIVALPQGGTRIYALAVRDQVQVIIDDDGGVTIVEPDDAGISSINIHWVPLFVIRASDDFGASWTSHDLAFRPGYDASLEAIDPKEPDRIVIARRLDNSMFGGGPAAIPDQLLVSDDAGATFRDWFTVSSIAGVSIANDGATYVADRGEGHADDPKGLWRADRAGAEPELIADYDTWCVEARADRLEVCQRYDWGTADPETGVFTKLASFFDLSTFHSCDGFDSAATCRDELCASHCLHWKDIPLCVEHYPECATENLYSMPDAEPTPVASDAGRPSESASSGCSCNTAGHRDDTRAALIGAAFAALLTVRRSRRAKRASVSDTQTAS